MGNASRILLFVRDTIVDTPISMARHQHHLDKFIDETRASQRNIVFPDTVRKARSVDAFLWRGSPHPSLVQSIAAWIIGLVFIGIGVQWFFLAVLNRSSFGDVLLMVTMAVGGWCKGLPKWIPTGRRQTLE